MFVYLFLVSLPESNFREVGLLSFLLAAGLPAHGRGSKALFHRVNFLYF